MWCDMVCVRRGVDGGGVTLCVSDGGVCSVTLCPEWMDVCVV